MDETGTSESGSSAQPERDPLGSLVLPVDRRDFPVSILDVANDDENSDIAVGKATDATSADTGSAAQERPDVSHTSPIDGGEERAREMKCTCECCLVVHKGFTMP